MRGRVDSIFESGLNRADAFVCRGLLGRARGLAFSPQFVDGIAHWVERRVKNSQGRFKPFTRPSLCNGVAQAGSASGS